MQEKILNKIIAADDLHWCPPENRYTALSMEELDIILLNSIKNNINDEKDLYQIVKWATNARVGEILLKNYMEGKIQIHGFDDTGEPIFGSK
jgi:hypothetical protein